MNNEEIYFERTERNQFYFGDKEGQTKIRNLKIAIAGLGGMGSNVAEALARLGVGHLRIADPDTIDISNINRQVIANRNTVGKSKAHASADEIKTIDPEIELKVFDQGVEESMVDEFVKGCDFVVDEIDVFPLERHIELHKAARKYNIPIYSAYVVGFGIHFYKFQGEEYKFEDFIGDLHFTDDKNKLDRIVDKFGYPLPNYLNNEQEENFKKRTLTTGVPIFGPATLMGHSIVATRILVDHLESSILGTGVAKTPIMPEFVKIDLANLTLTKEKISL